MNKNWIRGRQCSGDLANGSEIWELRKRGITAQEAAKTAGSSDGPSPLTNAPVLKIALSNAFFAALWGFPSSGLMISSTRRTAGCGPHVRSRGRGEWATAPPMPIQRLRVAIGFQ